MESRYPKDFLQNIESISFSGRALLLISTMLVSLVVYELLGLTHLISKTLFFSLFPIAALGLLHILNNSKKYILIPFISILLIFITVFIDSYSTRTFGISLKINQLTFLISLLFSLVYLISDFKYFISRREIQLSLAFFLLTFIYYFFYASDFDISRVKYGYVLLITAGLEINSPPVKTILLISSLSILVAHIITTAFFKVDQNKTLISSIQPLLRIIYSLLAFSLFFIILMIISKGAKLNYGMHYYLPLILIFGYAASYFISKYHKDTLVWPLQFHLRTVFNVSLITSTLFLPLLLNKTSIFGTIFSFILFFWGSRGLGYGNFFKKILHFASQDTLAKLIITIGILVLFVMGMSFGIFELFSEKVDYVVSGITKNSSMKVREGNWQYFLQNWWQTLNLQHLLFGYGIGASRKSIFFISAMRDNPHESNLVQTLHNSYMEYIYDYGLMCLLYFGMYFHFLNKALRQVHNCNPDIRVLVSAQLGIILYTAFYGLTDGIRVQMLVQIFTLLSFLEGLKVYYKRQLDQAGPPVTLAKPIDKN